MAQKFRAAGLETEIVPYRVLMNQPKMVKVEAYRPAGQLLMSGPAREHVEGDPFQDDPRVVMPFNGSSGSGDVTGEVVYANYGRLEDFDHLAAQHIDLHGKIVIVRYGSNFRGVKVYMAEQRGAAGVLIYSDPQDDGYYKGDAYPDGPWRPARACSAARCSISSSIPAIRRRRAWPRRPICPTRRASSPEGNQPHIISIPISYHDAAPILQNLKGPSVPQGWQGALPFRYHVGGQGGVKVHLVSQQDYQRRTIWDVIGKVKGTEYPDDWVVAGNHRDAWVYGAVDPNSGTAAMLEAVHGIGALLKEGWQPKRTMVFCSWDAEEEGLIGSTEWVEQHAKELENAVIYINVDVAVAGPDFSASAVPSLKQFIREVTRSVPSPTGAHVYDAWRNARSEGSEHRPSNAPSEGDVRVGDLGSGSDFTPFLQHVGVPSTDIGSGGPYGVYHSVFDNYAWFTMNADPRFVYLQEMARVFGLEALRMADTDVLPYDYVTYAREITRISRPPSTSRASTSWAPSTSLRRSWRRPTSPTRGSESGACSLCRAANPAKINAALRQAETALLSPAGLPNRPWYRHTSAPGEYTGYAAVVIPGVNEAIDAKDANRTRQQLEVLADALNHAAQALNAVP